MSNIKDIVMRADLVMFDVDQTLVDSHARNEDAVDGFVQVYSQGEDHTFRSFVLTNGATPVAKELTTRLNSPVTPEEVSKLYVQFYFQSDQPISVYNGSIASIHYLRERGKLVAAVTSACPVVWGINRKLLHESNGDENLFHAEFHAEPGIDIKPEPEAYRTIQQRLEKIIPANRAVMIGDSNTDRQFAENIGAPFIQITREYQMSDFYRELIE